MCGVVGHGQGEMPASGPTSSLCGVIESGATVGNLWGAGHAVGVIFSHSQESNKIA